MATRYSRGRQFEYRVRDDLRERGCLVVRAAGSKGKVDLLAVLPLTDESPGEILLVQCKRDTWGTPAERTELCRLAEVYGATALLARMGNPGVSYRHYVNSTQNTPWGE
jgi:Holliday junction resolvase